MVTVNGRPLSIVNDSGFKKIINPILESFGNTFSINQRNVRKNVIETANLVISDLKNLVKNRILSLKIDGATRLDKSILGINVQFISDESTHVVKTLAMIELTESHTANYLKKKVLEVLNKYDIKQQQILTITTDSACNMVKMVECMSNIERDEFLIENNNMESISNDTTEHIDDENVETVPMDNFPEGRLCPEEINGLLGELDTETTIDHLQLENIEMEFLTDIHIVVNEPKPVTVSIRCSAHTLQLCIEDALKTRNSSLIISKARSAVKKLRIPTVAGILKKMKQKGAIIDVETRWCSKFDMLKRLLDLKSTCVDLCDTFKELKLTENEWSSIEKMLQALSPAKTATIELQKETLTLGDFFGVWLKCYTCTKLVDSGLANDIIIAMDTRGSVLKNNSVFLAAIYLDPRFQWYLSQTDKYAAKLLLKDIWTIIMWLETGIETESNISVPPIESFVDDSLNDDLEQYIRSQSSASDSLDLSFSFQNSNSMSDIRRIIDDFDNVPRLHHSTNILEYWRNCINSKPELHKLAMVSVERAFSGLKFILSDLRSSLKTDMLENILMIRNNHTFK
ncbi:unnamed protein product [Macrosiphum euphorbiae]|uniref:Zinc finger BED domain-containing protein RICESLEEPER 1-like n=1 Tax=Macrosiphum euphorbiae TaxID=13131 RepID=A0AAV0Y7H0_9HEMI|nr:unnamed protein product [Macrosiphum euphorbiae]